MTHSARPPWKVSRWEQHVLVAAVEARKDLLHPAGTLQGWLFGDHRTASLAGDESFVGVDIALAEDSQCMGWPFADVERGCDTLGRHCFILFASRKTVN